MDLSETTVVKMVVERRLGERARGEYERSCLLRVLITLVRSVRSLLTTRRYSSLGRVLLG
jgi:hypothetical protein